MWWYFILPALCASDEIQVDCDSGAVDSASSLDTLTDALCVAQCTDKCASAGTEAEVDACLSEDVLIGCLFDVTTLNMTSVPFCRARSLLNTTALVMQISADTLDYYGDGSDVHGVWLAANTSDVSTLKTCNHTTNLGISLTAYDASTCVYSGVSYASQPWGASDNGTLTTNITEMVAGAFGASTPLTLYAEFADSTCGNVTFDDVAVVFSLTYKSGYRPSQSCRSIDACSTCLANGCTWCDWSGTVNTLLPGWLPDWSWVENAREGKNGLCGINSAVCKTSLGAVNTCNSAGSLFNTLIVPFLLLVLSS